LPAKSKTKTNKHSEQQSGNGLSFGFGLVIHFPICAAITTTTDQQATVKIRTAAQYLTHLPTVECVVLLTFLRACAQLPDRPNDLRVPALALVFRRGQGTVQHRNGQDIQRVRVTQLRSFGNVGIPQDELTCFTRLRANSLLEEPIAGVDALVDHEQVGLFPGPLDMMNLDMSLAQARTRAREIAQERLDNGAALDAVEFRIPMPAPLAAIQLDLIDVFHKMMLGDDFDRHGVAARDAAARAPAGGVEAADAAAETPSTQVDVNVDMDAGAEAARDNDQ
jgi:hypothetical protein